MSTRVISFHYTLKDKAGSTLDSSQGSEPMAFLEGSGMIIPGLETALLLMSVGDKKNVSVVATDAYGEYDKSLVLDIPRAKFPSGEVAVGDQFRANSDEHEPSPVFTVTKVTDSHVSVDGNHPLAGQDLFFDVEVMDIRPATQEELSHGHIHGAGGHHHH